jgi:hypothetical protein
MTKLVNRAKMTTATTGTGTLTLGSAVDGYQTFSNAGVANADVVRYVIEDGDAWEIGLGTYTSSGTTLTRGSIESSNADAALNLTGNAVVFVTAAGEDIFQPSDLDPYITSAALSGTTPSVDVGARDTYTLTTSGNTTFTFTGVPSSGQVGTFSLIITAGGTHTLTWPASVLWAGGTAPDAPASGATDVYTFLTVDGGTTFYGFLAGDAMA